MKKLSAIAITLLLMGAFSAGAYAEDERPFGPPAGGKAHDRYVGRNRPGNMPRNMPENMEVTPYGDYCPLCSPYGACREELRPKEAERAIRAYFKDKGLDVKNIENKGRFVKAEIFRGPRLVDRVIFDKKTGRLRSIY